MADDPDLPSGPGAYGLFIRLRSRLDNVGPRRTPSALASGLYLYAGSAWGPGGIRARVARHLRPQKPLWWHIDRLTEAGEIEAAMAVPQARECELIAAVISMPSVEAPVPGFGSSDCKRCRAHLLALGETDAARLRGRFRELARRPVLWYRLID